MDSVRSGMVFPIRWGHTINNIVNIRRIDNIIDRVRAGLSILLSIILNVIILTSIKMDIVNIDIDNIIDRVQSAIGLNRGPF